MESYETYASVVTAGSVALLLVAAGVAKKQLVWKRPRPLPVRSRRRKRWRRRLQNEQRARHSLATTVREYRLGRCRPAGSRQQGLDGHVGGDSPTATCPCVLRVWRARARCLGLESRLPIPNASKRRSSSPSRSRSACQDSARWKSRSKRTMPPALPPSLPSSDDRGTCEPTIMLVPAFSLRSRATRAAPWADAEPSTPQMIEPPIKSPSVVSLRLAAFDGDGYRARHPFHAREPRRQMGPRPDGARKPGTAASASSLDASGTARRAPTVDVLHRHGASPW